jgi:hypothetical protein
MNKYTKISLLGLVTIVLLMAMAIPALAREQKETSCYLEWLAHYEKDGSEIDVQILADDGAREFEEDTATHTCTGSIPLGGTRYNPMVVYYDLTEMKKYLCEEYGGDACSINVEDFTIGPAEYGDKQNWMIYKGEKLYSSTWSLSVDDETGEYKLISVYELP